MDKIVNVKTMQIATSIATAQSALTFFSMTLTQFEHIYFLSHSGLSSLIMNIFKKMYN